MDNKIKITAYIILIVLFLSVGIYNIINPSNDYICDAYENDDNITINNESDIIYYIIDTKYDKKIRVSEEKLYESCLS